MENLLSQLKHRYIYNSESNFSYFLLGNSNLFYIYINGEERDLKESIINKGNNHEYCMQRLKSLKIKEPMTSTLLEGYYSKDNIYLTDVYFYNGILVNQNFKSRYFLLKKVLSCFEENSRISLAKCHFNISLEDLYTDIIPNLNIRVLYICMKKNISQYFIPLDKYTVQNEGNNVEPEKKNTKKILMNVEELKEKTSSFMIYASSVSEIYVIDHGDYYSVLRIPDLKTSKYMKNLEIGSKGKLLQCKYNKMFKKYEIVMT